MIMMIMIIYFVGIGCGGVGANLYVNAAVDPSRGTISGGRYFDCDGTGPGTICIPCAHVCDGVDDCLNAADEANTLCL